MASQSRFFTLIKINFVINYWSLWELRNFDEVVKTIVHLIDHKDAKQKAKKQISSWFAEIIARKSENFEIILKQ